MRKLIFIFVLALCGCGARIHQGVQATITQDGKSWDSCSLNIDEPYEYRHTLIFTDVKGKVHTLSGNWRVDYSKVPCFN